MQSVTVRFRVTNNGPAYGLGVCMDTVDTALVYVRQLYRRFITPEAKLLKAVKKVGIACRQTGEYAMSRC